MEYLIGLKKVLVNPVNLIFLALQLAVFVSAYRRIGQTTKRATEFLATAPDRLTGLGILGTFTGVFLGLLRFDPAQDQIQSSVTTLLTGMTTAFFTSVVGLILALVLRTLTDRYQSAHPVERTGTNIADLIAEVRNLRTEQTAIAKAASLERIELKRALVDDSDGSVRAVLQRLQEAVGGDGDATLLSQVRLLRQDSTDQARRQAELFERFSAQVAELGSKALTDALRAVIADFNAKLTEQFGDNFKQLNLAVHKLVEWQEAYRQQLDVQIKALASTQQAMTAAEEALGRVSQHTSEIPQHLLALSKMLAALDAQEARLTQQLTAYAELGKRAVAAMPLIEARLVDLTDGLSASVAAMMERLEEAQEAAKEEAALISATHQLMQKELQKAHVDIVDTYRGMVKQLEESQATLQAQLRDAHTKAQGQWRELLESSVEEQNSIMRQQIDQLDQALETELQKAMTLISQHLVGLTEKLVADYTPLFANARQLIEFGRVRDSTQ